MSDTRQPAQERTLSTGVGSAAGSAAGGSVAGGSAAGGSAAGGSSAGSGSGGAGTSVVGAAKNAVKTIVKGWDEYPAETGGKRGQMLCGWGDGVPTDAPYYKRLQSDLANSYYWSGNFLLDFAFFVAQWHPVLGLLFSHPNHPWTKIVRFEMQLISLMITLVPSAAIGVRFRGESQWWSYGKTMMIVCFVTIPDIISGVLLYQVSIAHTRCPMCAPFWDLVKKCCICNVFLCAVISAGICWFILTSTQTDWITVVEPFIEGRAWSFITWFPIWFFLPCQLGFLELWCWERRWAGQAERKAERKAEKAERKAQGKGLAEQLPPPGDTV